MSEPRYVLAMGACACGGGPFKDGYSVVSGIDEYLPVDVYIPGCPPTPQALLYGFSKIREKIDSQSLKEVKWYQPEPIEPVPVPILGPDLMDMRKLDQIMVVAKQQQIKEEQAINNAAKEDGDSLG